MLVDTGPPGGPILRAAARGGRAAARRARAHPRPGRPRGRGAGGARARFRAGLCSTAAPAGRPPAQRGAAAPRRAPAARAVAAGARARRCAPGGIAAARPLAAAAGAERRPDGDPNDRALVAHVRGGRLRPAAARRRRVRGHRRARPAATSRRSRSPTTAARTPGLPALLERLRPEVAAIEVGARNTYGHPAPSHARARCARCRVVRTDRDGTVRLRVAGRRMTGRATGASRPSARLDSAAVPALQARLPDPRRRPRPHRRAARAAARDGRDARAGAAASRCSRATRARPTRSPRALVAR